MNCAFMRGLDWEFMSRRIPAGSLRHLTLAQTTPTVCYCDWQSCTRLCSCRSNERELSALVIFIQHGALAPLRPVRRFAHSCTRLALSVTDCAAPLPALGK